MSWATHYITKLENGESVDFRPRGNSMVPLVHSGDHCFVEPLSETPEVGDIVLCRVGRSQYLHLVTAIQGDRFQISNNHGRVNGMIGISNIYGKLVRIDNTKSK